MNQLQDALSSVDRLNSWVRSESYRQGNWDCRKAIYYLKRSALKKVLALGWPANHRAVVATVRCRDCDGSGRYLSSYGNRKLNCYPCNSTGLVRLEFIESSLPGGITWHTPRQEWQAIAPGLLSQQAPMPVMDWQPNQTGKDLSIVEAANALNLAEVFFPDRPSITTSPFGYCYIFDYKFWLGRIEGSDCRLCGREGELNTFVCSRDLFTWHDRACNACADQSGIFDLFPFPDPMAAHPAIQEWHARHEQEHQRLERYQAQRNAWAKEFRPLGT